MPTKGERERELTPAFYSLSMASRASRLLPYVHWKTICPSRVSIAYSSKQSTPSWRRQQQVFETRRRQSSSRSNTGRAPFLPSSASHCILNEFIGNMAHTFPLCTIEKMEHGTQWHCNTNRERERVRARRALLRSGVQGLNRRLGRLHSLRLEWMAAGRSISLFCRGWMVTSRLDRHHVIRESAKEHSHKAAGL